MTAALLIILICAPWALVLIFRKKLRQATRTIQTLEQIHHKDPKEKPEFAAILKALPIGLAIYDKEARQEYVNDTIARMFGLTDIQAHLDRRICLFDDPSVSKEIREDLRKGLHINTVIKYDINKAVATDYLDTNLSQIMYLDTQVNILRNESGEIEKYILITNDITQKRMQELRELMIQIFDMLPIPIYIKDVEDDGKYIYWNKESNRIFGDVLSKYATDMFDNQKAKKVERIDREIFESEIPYTAEEHLKFLNGIEYDTHVHKSIIYSGKKKLLLGTRWDIGFRQELERKNKILSISMNALNAFTWFCDLRDGVLRFGSEFEKLGANALEMNSPEKFAQKIHPKDRERYLKLMEEFYAQESGEFTIEYEIDINNSGIYEWWECRGAMEIVTSNNISYKYLYGMIIKIHHLKQNELNILKTNIELDVLNAQNEMVLNNSNNGLAYLTNDYQVQWENISSFIPDHPMAQNYKKGSFCYKTVKNASEPCPGCVVARSVASGKIEKKEVTDGKEFAELTATPVFDSNNQRTGTILKIIDITEKAKINIELEKAKNRAETSNVLLRNIIDNLPCLLFIKDTGADFRHILVNRYFCKVLGLSEEEIIGKTDYDLFPTQAAAERCRRDDLHALNSDHIYIFEEDTQFQGKHIIWQTTKTTVKTAEGRQLLIALSLDITDKMTAYNELREAKEKAEQSNRLKSAFLANMSHEIRTPLNAIVGFSELMADSVEPKDKEEYSNIISANNELLLRLIGDILDLSKIEAGMIDLKPIQFDVAPLFKEISATFSKRINLDKVEFICNNPYTECLITFDKNRFTQLVSNFMTNATKFTTQGSICMGYELIDDGIKVYVTDTGIGIPKDKINKVFERFEKLNDFAQGTGLGMAICKAITDSCNGKIDVDSELGKGSTFWAWLPV